MAILTFPDALYRLAESDFALEPLVGHSEASAFNAQLYTTGPIVEVWRARVTLVPMVEADWRALRAFLFSVRGGQNLVRLHDKASETLQGAGGSSPTVNAQAAANAGATSITLKNLTASQAIGIAAGDMLGVGENLHTATADVASDGSGHATVSILPALRLGVAANDTINLAKPTGLFRLTNAPSVPVRPGKFSVAVELMFNEVPDVV